MTVAAVLHRLSVRRGNLAGAETIGWLTTGVFRFENPPAILAAPFNRDLLSPEHKLLAPPTRFGVDASPTHSILTVRSNAVPLLAESSSPAQGEPISQEMAGRFCYVRAENEMIFESLVSDFKSQHKRRVKSGMDLDSQRRLNCALFVKFSLNKTFAGFTIGRKIH